MEPVGNDMSAASECRRGATDCVTLRPSECEARLMPSGTSLKKFSIPAPTLLLDEE